MPYLDINQYSNGLVGHLNVTFLNDSLQATATFGSNPFNGTSGGVANENNWLNEPHSSTRVYISQSGYDNALAQSNYLHNATVTTGGSYWLLGANCVDFVDDVLGWAGHPYGVEHYTVPGTLIDFYAEFVAFISDVYWTVRDALIDDPTRVDIGQNFTYIVGTIIPELGGQSEISTELNFAYNDWFDNAASSPIAIDLGGDGLRTVALADSGVTFDLLREGVERRTGWLDASDGFIVVDRNGNGLIDDAGEMFGSTERGAGFAQLATFDSNGDGRIDGEDEAFGRLSVWQDANGNGATDAGELTGLAAHGIEALDLAFQSVDRLDHGNLIGEESSAIIDGREVGLYDVYFRYSRAWAIDGGTVLAQDDGVALDVAMLRELAGDGLTTISANGHDGVTIRGTAGDDRIDLSGLTLDGIAAVRAGAGDDALTGTAGDDVLIGGRGQDTLTGGGGADIFRYEAAIETPAAASDIITDFSAAEGDRIDLSAINALLLDAGSTPFVLTDAAASEPAPNQLVIDHIGGDTRLTGNVGGIGPVFSILFRGTVPLTADQFIT